MIDQRSVLEVSMYDSADRMRSLARASMEQCVPLAVIDARDVPSPLTRLLGVLTEVAGGRLLVIDLDGPVVLVSLVAPDLVQWDRALALSEPPAGAGDGSYAEERRQSLWQRFRVSTGNR